MLQDPFPYVDEVLEFRSSLSGETDRGCALMAAAYLADQLERLLRHTLVDDQAAVDELFRHLGPLSSFSGRIELCYALGLLPAEARRDLHLVRKIRNDFGHVAKTLTFEEPAIAARCRELHHSGREAEARPRAKFTSAVMGLCAVIHFFIHRATRRVVPSGVTMTEDRKREVRELAQKLAAAVEQEFELPIDSIPERSDT